MGLSDESKGTRIAGTIGNRLIALRNYSGLSLAEVAQRGGYKGASSVQKLFQPDYNPPHLPKEVAAKLAKAFVGAGDPPIRPEELSGLTEGAQEIETIIADMTHLVHLISDKIPLYTTEKIADFVETSKGYQIPLFIRSHSDAGEHFPCPKHLRGKQLLGHYVTVGSLWPRYEEGEIFFLEHRTPPVSGDDVVVTVVTEENLDGGMFIGRLTMRTDEEARIDLLSPQDHVTLPRNKIISIRRLAKRSDMLEPPRAMF
jgi:hypothetical protein